MNFQMPVRSRLSKKIRIAGRLSLFICFCALNIRGQANNSINGFIFGFERNPLPDMQVELLDEFNRLVVRVRTDGAGRYIFMRLSRGRFYVRVSTSGTNYEEQVNEVEIAGMSRGGASNAGTESLQQNFYLRLKRSPASSFQSSGVVFVQDVPKEAKRSYERAVAYLKDRKTGDALIEFKNAIAAFPDYYLALSNLGQEYVDLQQYEEARNVLAKAVAINSRSYETQYALGYSLYKLKSYADAIEAIKKSIEISPSSVNGYFLLGVNLKQTGNYDAAVSSLKKAEKLATVPSPEIHWQLSLLYTNNLKDYAAAAGELELFLKAKPDYDEAGKVRELIKKLRAKATKPIGGISMI